MNQMNLKIYRPTLMHPQPWCCMTIIARLAHYTYSFGLSFLQCSFRTQCGPTVTLVPFGTLIDSYEFQELQIN
jgi:hypothetical protein